MALLRFLVLATTFYPKGWIDALCGEWLRLSNRYQAWAAKVLNGRIHGRHRQPYLSRIQFLALREVSCFGTCHQCGDVYPYDIRNVYPDDDEGPTLDQLAERHGYCNHQCETAAGAVRTLQPEAMH